MCRLRGGVVLAMALLFASCSVPDVASPTPRPTPTRILSSFVSDTGGAPAVATPAVTPTSDPGIVLIWWPAVLYPTDETSGAARILREQVAGYAATHTRTIQIRPKRGDGIGGIYQTLHSGAVAAPGAMPDLTLLRRSDLVQAVADKLIEPIDVSSLAPDDLFPSALALGKVRGTQYGILYTLDVQHVVYRTTAFATPPRTPDDILESAQVYLFAAGAANGGVSPTLLAQYTALGGRTTDDQGKPVLDRGPLVEVLRFYEKAADKLIGASPTYTSMTQYWPLFISGKANLAQIDSSTYLSQRARLSNVAILPIPAEKVITPLDGWMWVITTSDPDKKKRAVEVLTWFMRGDQQGQFTHEIGALPSRRSALQVWGDDDYAAFARSLLEQSALPPPDVLPAAVVTTLQKAFEDVLAGRKTADLAADDALVTLGKTP
ncbi:MAG: extracellular solute-binding protein [Anaerolineae bacterium]|nr:extracellular solute-binding protein [Anaerolineae bacterium]